jgi:radical SAM protein (TIGR01212 family)
MFLAYFQAYSNTYASIEKLREIYDEALQHPSIVGIIVGTRPDCVDSQKLDLLAELRGQKYVAVEYGVESCYDKSLQRICRMHDFAASRRAIELTSSRNIVTGAHFIFGLPGESKEEMLAQVDTVSSLPVNTVKFHQLQIIKGTKMAEEYENFPKDFHEFTVPEYIDFVCDFVERLRPDIIIERIAGEVPPRYLAIPAWCALRNDQLLAMFEKRLEERKTYQGRLFLDG